MVIRDCVMHLSLATTSGGYDGTVRVHGATSPGSHAFQDSIGGHGKENLIMRYLIHTTKNGQIRERHRPISTYAKFGISRGGQVSDRYAYSSQSRYTSFRHNPIIYNRIGLEIRYRILAADKT